MERVVAVAAVVVAVGLAVLAWRANRDLGAPFAGRSPAGAVGPAPAVAMPADPARPAVAARATVEPTATTTAAASLFEANDADAFAAEAPPTQWDASCRDRSGLRFATVAEALADSGLDLAHRFPRRGRVIDFAQFYAHDGGYVQVSAEWNYDDPALYRIRVLGFDDDEFSNPQPVYVGGAGRWVAEGELASAVARVDGELVDAGARRGSRSMVVATDLPAAGETTEGAAGDGYVIEMRDGLMVRLHAPGVSCQTRGNVAVCRCPGAHHHDES